MERGAGAVTGERFEAAIADVRAKTQTTRAEFEAAVDALVAASPLNALDGPAPRAGTVPAAVSRSGEASVISEGSEA